MKQAADKIESINNKAKRTTYLEKLQNYKVISETIYARSYYKNAFIAGLIAQIELAYKVNKSKELNAVVVEGQAEINNIHNVEQISPQKEIVGKPSILRKLPNSVPDNVLIDKAENDSYIDTDFVTKGLKRDCVWVRAKNIHPKVK